ncbi:MAG: HAMP domain-containing sensor histidine kinase [candidate division WOR-3 bacterium]
MVSTKELRYYLNFISFTVIVVGSVAYFYLKDLGPPKFVNLFIVAGVFVALLNFAVYFLFERKTSAGFWVSTLLYDFVVAVMSVLTGGIESRLPYLLAFPIPFAVHFQGLAGGSIQSLISLLVVFSLSQIGAGPLGEQVHLSPSPVIKNLSYFVVYTLVFAFLTAIAMYFRNIIKDQAKDLLDFKLSSEEILNSVPSGIMTLSSDGELLFVNRSANEILTTEERSQFVKEMLNLRGAVRREIQLGERIIGFSQKILENGTRMVVFQDLTDYKKMEEERKELEKLAFLGELAGNLAHEIRNPVQAISLATELLLSDRTTPDKELLRGVQHDVERLSEIVNRFLHYAKIPELRPEDVSLKKIVESAFYSVRNDFGGLKVNLVNEIPEEYSLRADAIKLEEFFLNIFRNSLEAQSEGNIEVRLLKKGEEYRLVDGYIFKASWDSLIVRDYGVGMDEETLRRAKELFFTTKKTGTGFGLAFCDRIVKSHGWKWQIHSVKNIGTDVVVEFVSHEN